MKTQGSIHCRGAAPICAWSSHGIYTKPMKILRILRVGLEGWKTVKILICITNSGHSIIKYAPELPVIYYSKLLQLGLCPKARLGNSGHSAEPPSQNKLEVSVCLDVH